MTSDCYLTFVPNVWGCHDPQCHDSTWDHDCPVGPCRLAEHGNAPGGEAARVAPPNNSVDLVEPEGGDRDVQ